MTRISKTAAHEVAIALTKNQRIDLVEQEKRLSHVVTSLVLDRIPKEVHDFYEKFPQYVKTTGGAYLKGLGWGGDFLTLEGSVPNIGHNHNFVLNFETNQHEKAANGLRKLYNNLQQSKKDLTALRCDIENTLYALKTLKAISEHFPEALPYLSKTPNTSLIIDTTALRQRLK
jgi:hypothetical protein